MCSETLKKLETAVRCSSIRRLFPCDDRKESAMEIKTCLSVLRRGNFLLQKIPLIFVIILTEKNMEPKCLTAPKIHWIWFWLQPRQIRCLVKNGWSSWRIPPWFKKKESKREGKSKRPMVTRSCSLIIPHIPMKMPAWCLLPIKRTSAWNWWKLWASCGKVREYKPLSRWELPDYLENIWRVSANKLTAALLDLLLMLWGTVGRSCEWSGKNCYFCGRTKRIEENDILRVVSCSAEVNSFQLSDALGERDPRKIYRLASNW